MENSILKTVCAWSPDPSLDVAYESLRLRCMYKI